MAPCSIMHNTENVTKNDYSDSCAVLDSLYEAAITWTTVGKDDEVDVQERGSHTSVPL